MSRPDEKLLEAHIAAGHDLFPLNARAKTPSDKGWRAKDYSDQDPREWMRRGLNVGVRLRPDELAVDFDRKRFTRVDPVKEFCREFDIDPGDCIVVKTGGGGFHLYFKKPAWRSVRGKIDGWPEVDVKGHGGFVVAAGSLHESGQVYRAEPNWLDEFVAPPAPQKLLDALSKQTKEIRHTEEAGQLSCEQLEEMLACLDPADFRDYDRWIALGMACHHATAGEGREAFINWCTNDPPYNDHRERVEAHWDSFGERPGGVTANTLYKAISGAGRNDLVEKAKRSSAQDDFSGLPVPVVAAQMPTQLRKRDDKTIACLANCLILVNRLGLGLAFNELTRRFVMTADDLPFGVDIGRELNDDVIRQIRLVLMAQHKAEFSKEDVTEACLTVARRSTFNPVTDYLDSLSWDGAARVGTWLARYVGAEESDYTRAVGRATLIAAVRRARRPGCKFDTVLILEGKQGTEKSSAIKVLGGDWYSDAELGRLDHKEAAQLLQGTWIHELPELNSFERSEIAALKAYLSRSEDKYRAPYERTWRTEARRCVFIGTSNSDAYLRDATGNRRFWPVKTGAVDLEALARDRDQLWAEAAEAEAAGESITLARELWADAAQEQAARQLEDPWADLLRGYLDSGDKPMRRVMTREILEYALGLEPGQQNSANGRRLREIMPALGWSYRPSMRIGKSVGSGYERDGASDPLD